jgi:hypothetical protein
LTGGFGAAAAGAGAGAAAGVVVLGSLMTTETSSDEL